MIYFFCHHPRPLKRNDLLARAEYRKKHYERTLAAGCFLGRESGFASEMGPGLALPLMEILISDGTVEEKIKALDQIELLRLFGEEERETVRQFTGSAELAEKVKRMKVDAE
jgi:hypothetical protein